MPLEHAMEKSLDITNMCPSWNMLPALSKFTVSSYFTCSICWGNSLQSIRN